MCPHPFRLSGRSYCPSLLPRTTRARALSDPRSSQAPEPKWKGTGATPERKNEGNARAGAFVCLFSGSEALSLFFGFCFDRFHVFRQPARGHCPHPVVCLSWPWCGIYGIISPFAQRKRHDPVPPPVVRRRDFAAAPVVLLPEVTLLSRVSQLVGRYLLSQPEGTIFTL